jgi:hypothetical protein
VAFAQGDSAAVSPARLKRPRGAPAPVGRGVVSLCAMREEAVNTALVHLGRLASCVDGRPVNRVTQNAALVRVLGRRIKPTVAFIARACGSSQEEAGLVSGDVAACAMFDTIRGLGRHGECIALPLRICLPLPGAAADAVLNGTVTVAGRVKHYPCGVAAAEFIAGTALRVVREAMHAANGRGLRAGLLRPAMPGVEPGAGLVMAGGAVHNALLPAAERQGVTVADIDVFVAGAVQAAGMADLVSFFLEEVAQRMEPAGDITNLVTERSVTAGFVIPHGALRTGGVAVHVGPLWIACLTHRPGCCVVHCCCSQALSMVAWLSGCRCACAHSGLCSTCSTALTCALSRWLLWHQAASWRTRGERGGGGCRVGSC